MVDLKLKGLNKVRSKGRVYYYHRKTGTRLKAEFGTGAFLDELAALNEKAAKRPEAGKGTLGGLIDAYKRSPEFFRLKPSTRADYDDILSWLAPLHAKPLHVFDPAEILDIRDEAYTRRKWRFANYVVRVMSLLFAWGKLRRWVESNPAEGVPLLPRPKEWARANRPWSGPEIKVAIEEAATRDLPQIAAAIVLGLMSLREGDVILFPWTGYRAEEEARRIVGRYGKNGKEFDLIVPAPLAAILDATPRRSTQIVAGSKSRRPYSADGFRSVFFRFIAELREEGKVGAGLTFHGLRHSVGNLLAELGFDTRSIKGWLGHYTESQALHYSDRADQSRRVVKMSKALERKWKGFAKPGDKSAKPGPKKSAK